MTVIPLIVLYTLIPILAIIIGIAAVCISVFVLTVKSTKSITYRLLSAILAILFFFITTIVLLVVMIVAQIFPVDDVPPSGKYHVLNAAVKNTCYLDPKHLHCPKTAEELIQIEDKNFTMLTKDSHITYRYYPETNDYTLIVRDNNLKTYNYRVALYDSRISKLGNYGYTGLDFYDTYIGYCGPKYYCLSNPPALPGPWNEIN